MLFSSEARLPRNQCKQVTPFDRCAPVAGVMWPIYIERLQMYYIVETEKSFEQASTDLAESVRTMILGFCIFITWVTPCAAKVLSLGSSAMSLKCAIPNKRQRFYQQICVSIWHYHVEYQYSPTTVKPKLV
jgi:hypothetical protein